MKTSRRRKEARDWKEVKTIISESSCRSGIFNCTSHLISYMQWVIQTRVFPTLVHTSYHIEVYSIKYTVSWINLICSSPFPGL